jgi:fatty acid desaturase
MNMPDFVIPHKTNMYLFAVCTIAFFLIPALALVFDSIWATLLLAIPFAIVQTTIYSLLHEAEHNLFHPSKKHNRFYGVFLGLMFGGSFTFLKISHLRHHSQNRSDMEIFDYYYENESKLKKMLGFYYIMIGGFWLLIPLASVLIGIMPTVLRLYLSKNHNYAKGKLSQFTPYQLDDIRKEGLALLFFQCAVFLIFDSAPLLIFYGLHALVWSSQNYIGHAFSERHVIRGAHNHRISWFGKWIYLNFNLHLVHHRFPNVPWIHLPQLLDQYRQEHNFMQAWARLWKGPVPISRSAAYSVSESESDSEVIST